MDQADFSVIVRALSFAALKHRDQRRKDHHGSPYINHPIDLMRVLSTEAGILDPIILSAALLHDTLEDTQTSSEELMEHFGAEICAIVQEVTDDKSLPKAERKRLQVIHAGQISQSARLVKLADKISNIRDVADNPPAGWDLERRQAYFDWAAEVIDQVRGTHSLLERLFDEAVAKRP